MILHVLLIDITNVAKCFLELSDINILLLELRYQLLVQVQALELLDASFGLELLQSLTGTLPLRLYLLHSRRQLFYAPLESDV